VINNTSDNSDNIESTSNNFKHGGSKSIDIKRNKKISSQYTSYSEGNGNSEFKNNTAPKSLPLKTFSPFSPFHEKNNYFLNDNHDKSKFDNDNKILKKTDKNEIINKNHFIDKQLPIVMFENFKKV